MEVGPVGRGAYLCEKNIRWDPNEADCEGWLAKKSKWIGEWRQRYFILKGSKLFFAKGETDAPHGAIEVNNIISCKSVEGDSSQQQQQNAIELLMKTEDPTILCAPNSPEKELWIQHISMAIQKQQAR